MVCLTFLLLGRWLKALAGEAAASLVGTSEAHFLSLLELGELRHEETDATFLARRVCADPGTAVPLQAVIRKVRDGRMPASAGAREPLDLATIALLYLHYLDGGILHESDTKTTEQLLANLALQDVRSQLRFTKADWKRTRKLNLQEGSIFGGPYLWFRFVVESVALEAEKRILDYNRNCLSLAQRERVPPERRAAFEAWLANRRSSIHGRMSDKVAHARTTGTFAGFEFSALDFLTSEPERDASLAERYGLDVLDLLQKDRARMIREIFGTRPLDTLPPSERSLNFFVLYQRRLSGGRVLFLPVFFVLWLLCGVAFMVRRVGAIAREILRPERTAQGRESGRAPFLVALRKIRRMKGPGLLEAMRLRVLFDPEYCGVPARRGAPFPPLDSTQLERDLDFLQLNARDRQVLRADARAVRERVGAFWAATGLDGAPALAVAAAIDRDHLTTHATAETWFARTVARLEDERVGIGVRFVPWLFAKARGTRSPASRGASAPDFPRGRGRVSCGFTSAATRPCGATSQPGTRCRRARRPSSAYASSWRASRPKPTTRCATSWCCARCSP